MALRSLALNWPLTAARSSIMSAGNANSQKSVELAGIFFTSFSSSLISALIPAAAFFGAPGCQVIASLPATALDSGYQAFRGLVLHRHLVSVFVGLAHLLQGLHPARPEAFWA